MSTNIAYATELANINVSSTEWLNIQTANISFSSNFFLTYFYCFLLLLSLTGAMGRRHLSSRCRLQRRTSFAFIWPFISDVHFLTALFSEVFSPLNISIDVSLSLLLRLIFFLWRLIHLDSLFYDFTFVCYTHSTTGVCKL